MAFSRERPEPEYDRRPDSTAEAFVARDRRLSRAIDVVYRFDPSRPTPRRTPHTPAEAQRRLRRGNRAFAELLDFDRHGAVRVIPLDPSDVGHGVEPGVAPIQRPFAAVLGCSDARVPIEMIFQQRANDLFVVRVAGNGVGSGCLGSLRYAADQFSRSLKLVVVLGHSQCGAVTAAVDAFLRPKTYLPLAVHYPLRAIVDSILVAVRSASLVLEAVHGARVSRLPGYRAALIDTSVALNASLAAFALRPEVERRSCRVLFGCYDLASRFVRLPLAPTGSSPTSEIGLFPPPCGDEDVHDLATRLATSAGVTQLLRAPASAARRNRARA
jgi:carbonic anhydrase